MTKAVILAAGRGTRMQGLTADLPKPMLLAGAVTGMGITFVGALFAMKQVVDEMARVEMILTLASDLSLESLTEVARRLDIPGRSTMGKWDLIDAIRKRR